MDFFYCYITIQHLALTLLFYSHRPYESIHWCLYISLKNLQGVSTFVVHLQVEPLRFYERLIFINLTAYGFM
jgi:hypothetical protein